MKPELLRDAYIDCLGRKAERASGMSVRQLDGVAIGRRLRGERLKLGLNQLGFAELLGLMSAVAVSNYERGQVPSLHILARYAAVTGRSEQYLIQGDTPDGRGTSDARVKTNKLDMTKRRLRRIIEDLCDSGDKEILGHLRQELRLLKRLSDLRRAA